MRHGLYPLFFMAGLAACGAMDFYVDPAGDDTFEGSEARPFATVIRARDAVRQLKQVVGVPKGGIVVHVQPGTYELTETLDLDDRDSGTPTAPVVYRGSGPHRPRLSGGRRLPPEAFVPVTDRAVLPRVDPMARDTLLVCDLQTLGLTEYGELSREAFNGGPMLELFVNGHALPLSRWPNGREWATYGNVVDAGSVPRWQEKPDRAGTLEYNGDRPERWKDATEVWLHGYWAYDWYDDVLKVQTLDTEQQRITFTTPHMYGLKAKRRYAALNLLEEIDAPGEWVLDRQTGKLYLLPAGPLDAAEIVLSMVQEPLLRLQKTHDVHVIGLTFEYGRGSAVDIRGGTDNLIAGCTIRNMGCGAVSVAPAETRSDGPLRLETGDEQVDGRRNVIRSCDIYNVGTSGINLTGGDRRSLAPGQHAAINNDIHHYSRRKRTGCPAIGLNGVGLRAAYNAIHDAPHTGLVYGGNEHLIEFNELAHLCWETGDVGAIYSGRDWTFRGNVIRHNFIHHTLAPGQVGSMGVYLDDSHSSTTVFGNVFLVNDYAAFMGGGRDNVIDNNIFIDCRKSVHLDNRSQGWANKYQVPGGDHRMYGKLKDIRHDQPPYSERYPELARILDESPHEPRGNKVLRNVCVRGTWLHVFQGAEAIMEIADNLLTDKDPGFVDAANLDFSLRPDSRVFTEIPGFQQIPFGKIGLHLEEFRTALPPRAPRILPDGRAFTTSLDVSLQSRTEDYEIRYTLDGSDPTPASRLYTGTITLAETATVSAAAFAPGDPASPPSPVATARFTHVAFGTGKGVYLSDLEPESFFAHGGLIRDQNYAHNDFITMSGTVFRKGLMLHAEILPEGGSGSFAVYALSPPLNEATRFKAVVGIGDGGDQRGSVSFKVELLRGDTWEAVAETPVLRGRPNEDQVSIDVPISGAAKIRLSTDGGNDISSDHAAWGDARLE